MGPAPRFGRRAAAVLPMLAGALAGAWLLDHAGGASVLAGVVLILGLVTLAVRACPR